MTQVENSIYQSVDLKEEEVLQIDNLIHLLIELKIIESPEPSCYSLPLENNNDEVLVEEIKLLQLPSVPLEVCEAYLESRLNFLSNIPIEEIKLLQLPSVPLEVCEAYLESRLNFLSNIP
ncbi:hypothetical protein VF12_34065, partial [Nostoc linckia z15]